MPKEPEVKTWQDLKPKKNRSVSWRARLRSFFIFIKFLLYLLIICGLGALGYIAYKNGTIQKAITPATEVLKETSFSSDGIISETWFLRNGFFPEAKNLADIDIVLLRKNFEKLRQIKSAEIKKIYPDKISITISERQPIARVAVARQKDLTIYAIASDGVFYEPICMETENFEKLLWLAGVPLVEVSNKLEPFTKAKELEAFLLLSKNTLPKNYETWESVNVSEISSITLPLIMVTTKSGLKIIFHINNLEFQLKKLEYVLRFYDEDALQKIEKIDLSLRTQAIITEKKHTR